MRNNQERLVGAQIQNQDATPPQVVNTEQTLQTQQINFIVPTEFVTLPSGGKFYPSNHPLHKKETLEIKQMTAKEEDILTSRNLLKKGVALDKLIQSLVVDKNINPDTLTIEDRNAIIIAARISGYGAEYKTQVACPSCGEKSKYNFNLLEKVDSQAEKVEQFPVTERGNFLIVLPASKWRVVCRALNGYDEKELLRVSESKKNTSGSDSILLEQMKRMVVSIEGVEDAELIEQALSSLRIVDSKYLRTEYQKRVPNVDLNHTFNCSKCDTEMVMEVPLTADFFWFK